MEKLKKKIFWVIILILTIFLVSILCIFNYQDYNHEKTEIENKLSRMEQNKGIPAMPENTRNVGITENARNEEMQNLNQSIENVQNKKMQNLDPNVDNINNDNNTESKNEENEKKSVEQPAMPVFMDAIIYTVKYNENSEVTEVLNYTQNSISEDEIKQIAERILKEENESGSLSNNKNTKSKIKIGNLYKEQYAYSLQEPNTLTIIDNTSSKTKLESLLKTSILIFVLVETIIIIVSVEITKWIIKPVIESFTKQKQFVADASHELKTPIAVIMANAEALEKEPKETKWLNNIKSEAERMNELVTNLLDLAKLEEGKEKEVYQEEDISKIVEMSVLTFESLMYENKIKLEYDIEKDVKINCNNSQIKQLVAILLDNAIKHSEANGEIKINLKKQKNDVILTVSNKGEEIPKEIQEKIFERFYRADESRNRNTNRYGLGLAIAKSIVENHNGKISVELEKGITTFKVVLK